MVRQKIVYPTATDWAVILTVIFCLNSSSSVSMFQIFDLRIHSFFVRMYKSSHTSCDILLGFCSLFQHVDYSAHIYYSNFLQNSIFVQRGSIYRFNDQICILTLFFSEPCTQLKFEEISIYKLYSTTNYTPYNCKKYLNNKHGIISNSKLFIRVPQYQ